MESDKISSLINGHKEIQLEVTGVKRNLHDVQQTLNRIEVGMFGDQGLGHDGVIKQLQDYRKFMLEVSMKIEAERVQKEKEKAELRVHKFWLSGVASVIGGGVATIFNHFFK
jgi:hypothetical protein